MVAFGIAFGYHRNNYGNEDCMRKCRGNKDLGMKILQIGV
jgi:hypothetical protein